MTPQPPPDRKYATNAGYFVIAMIAGALGIMLGYVSTTPRMLGLDCASAVIQHGEVRCIAFVDRTYKP